MNADNNTSSGSNGNRGKFSDRLKKIRRDRLLKNKNANFDEIQEENFFKRSSRNILKILLALPSVVYTSIKDTKNVKSTLNEDKIPNSNIAKMEIQHDISKQFKDIDEKEQARRIKVNKIRDIDVSLLKKQKEIYLEQQRKQNQNLIKDTIDVSKEKIVDAKSISDEKDKNIDISNKYGNKDEKSVDKNSSKTNKSQEKNVIFNENELKVTKLQKEIIDLIKKKLVTNINELEILQSELYLLKELHTSDIYLKDCQEDIKEIKKLLSKIKSLKEKYDFLRENVDFEYMLEYGDDLLIDKILELKSLCSSDDIRYTVDNYKILDEYKFLYLKIDKLQEDTIKYEEYKNSKAEELKKRDIDFDKLKNEVYDIDRENDRYDNFVREQELFLKELDDKVSRIDSYEDVTYRLKGFNQMLGNSFKYLGLLLLNPLKGLMPGIATQTLMTRNVIHNLYENLEWEENRRMVYEAIDYSASINNAINNLDLTASMIDSTLEDIIKLKERYKKEFSKYEYSFSGYRDAIKKINKMENAILGSKIKVENMQLRMKGKERQNYNKLKMVKKLNTSTNN